MKQSEKLGLNLPEDDDFFDVEHQNEKMRNIEEKMGYVDKIDDHINNKVCHITRTEREKWNIVTDLQKEISYLKEQGKTTIFNDDGSITEEFDDGMIKKIIFNSDGSITEKLTKDESVIKTKTIVFNTDGSIKEVVEWAGQK